MFAGAVVVPGATDGLGEAGAGDTGVTLVGAFEDDAGAGAGAAAGALVPGNDCCAPGVCASTT